MTLKRSGTEVRILLAELVSGGLVEQRVVGLRRWMKYRSERSERETQSVGEVVGGGDGGVHMARVLESQKKQNLLEARFVALLLNSRKK